MKEANSYDIIHNHYSIIWPPVDVLNLGHSFTFSVMFSV
jgi:hypothetical protein